MHPGNSKYEARYCAALNRRLTWHWVARARANPPREPFLEQLGQLRGGGIDGCIVWLFVFPNDDAGAEDVHAFCQACCFHCFDGAIAAGPVEGKLFGGEEGGGLA